MNTSRFNNKRNLRKISNTWRLDSTLLKKPTGDRSNKARNKNVPRIQ
jgi:hypothetical protein